jgi:predicted ATPase with chaperone activity
MLPAQSEDFMGTSLTSTVPPEPHSIEETSQSLSFLANLTLKIMYTRGLMPGHEIADVLKLPFPNIVESILDYLRQEHLTEVRGSTGFGESSYQYVISDDGRERARELMEQNQYIGPAPVRHDIYSQMIRAQSFSGRPLTRDMLKHGLSHLVLDDAVITQLGPAINSGKSIFLFGEPGNGKTTIAETIGTLLPGPIWIPYAISVDDHIIKVFDQLRHQIVPPPIQTEETLEPVHKSEHYDTRWVLARRPFIMAGGELAMEDLDLIYDATTKYYQAPYQMRANGGVFLVDDFGRQQVSPRDLLNRWIVPLEKRIDYLTLATGHKIDVPFDSLIIFATNLNPGKLADEAFLRRIRYKIRIPNPTWKEFREIFMREAAKRSIPYSDQDLQYLVMEYYVKPTRYPRGVHARDILDQLIDFAHFENVPPTMSKDLIDLACQAYFIKE